MAVGKEAFGKAPWLLAVTPPLQAGAIFVTALGVARAAGAALRAATPPLLSFPEPKIRTLLAS